jgi:hypothetical protein
MVPDDPSNWTFRTMESQVQDVSAWGIKKNIGGENLAAVQNHFLELYVHKVPPKEQAHINLAEEFDRYHFIVGTFERALSTLEKYSPSDFRSQHLYAYVIGALRKNSLYYEEVLNGTIDGEEETAAAADDNDNADDDNDDSHLFYEAGCDDVANNDDNEKNGSCHALRAIRCRRCCDRHP